MSTSHYFIGGGAEHTAEMVRREVCASGKGAEGVCTPTDLRVLPLSVNGEGVRVTIGSAYIRSRYSGARQETYMGAVVEQEIVPIERTGSQSPRSDLIVLRVRDPFVQGSPWSDPGQGAEDEAAADLARANAKYVYAEVIAGVPAGTTKLQKVPGYEFDSALTLARVDLPRQTGTVTAAMITDLREVYLPQEKIEVRGYGISGAPNESITATSPYPGGEHWPDAATEEGKFRLFIPEFATEMTILMKVAGVVDPSGGSSAGWFWVQVGRNDNPDKVITEPKKWEKETSSSNSRSRTLSNADTRKVPAALRGTWQSFFPRANRISGTNATSLRADNGSDAELLVVFREVPV